MPVWINWLAGLAALIVASFWLWPLLRGGPEAALIHWPLAYALSLGSVTLIMAAIGLMPGQWLSRTTVWGVVIVAGAIGGVTLIRQKSFKPDADWNRLWIALRSGSLRAWGGLGMVGVAVILTAFAMYYPFIGEDEISRYAFYAKRIWLGHSLGPDVRGYPMLMSLAYALTFFASSDTFEQLAKITPVLFSIMTVCAAAALAMRWGNGWAGWMAAALLAATPLYVEWSPVGYVDIPPALHLTLSAFAADVWLEKRNWRWAALAGVLAGLSLWTKQSGLVALASLGLVFAVAVLRDGRTARSGDAVRAAGHGLIALAAVFVAGGWWYVRNAIYDGWANAVPNPGDYYSNLAEHSWANALPFLGHPADFGYGIGLVYALGMAMLVVRVVRGGGRGHHFWLMAWSVPYSLLWFFLFSYDTRFLLTVLPFFAVLAALELAPLIERLLARRPSLRWAAVTGLLIAFAAGSAGRWGGVYHWTVNPLASNEQRLAHAKPDLAGTVAFLRDHTKPSANVISMDGRLSYYFADRPYRVFYPATAAAAKEADYLIVGSWAETVYPGFGLSSTDLFVALKDPAQFEALFTSEGGALTVYRVVK